MVAVLLMLVVDATPLDACYVCAVKGADCSERDFLQLSDSYVFAWYAGRELVWFCSTDFGFLFG